MFTGCSDYPSLQGVQIIQVYMVFRLCKFTGCSDYQSLQDVQIIHAGVYSKTNEQIMVAPLVAGTGVAKVEHKYSLLPGSQWHNG